MKTKQKGPHNPPNICEECGGWRIRPLDGIGIKKCGCGNQPMKPTIAYLHFHNGRIVASLTEMPNNNIPDQTSNEYIPLLKEWEAQLMDVENETKGISKNSDDYPAITWMNPQLGGHMIFLPYINHFGNIILKGQKAEIEITENGCKVTKLL